MTKKQINTDFLTKKEYGDTKQVARMLGLSRQNVAKILTRPNSKRYNEVVEAFRLVIETRESLNSNNQNTKNENKRFKQRHTR